MYSIMYSLSAADSLSSTLMTEITKYRSNDSGVMKKIQAEVGYYAVSAIAYKEASIAATATALSLLALPVSSEPTARCFKWLKSSTFTLGWSFASLFINPFANNMIANEQGARQFLANV